MDFWNTTPGDIEDIRDIPPGKYLAYVSGYQIDAAEDKPYVVLEFKVRDALSGQDMTGVELNRPLRTGRMYFTPAAKKYTKRNLKKLYPSLADGVAWKEQFENMVGLEAVIVYATTKGSNGKDYTNVVDFAAA
jgi:hypothetical protein